MPGFTPNGEIKKNDDSPKTVFTLKSSSGREIKTYIVPTENADIFESNMRAEELKLRAEAGEKDPLLLIKIDRCF